MSIVRLAHFIYLCKNNKKTIEYEKIRNKLVGKLGYDATSGCTDFGEDVMVQ